MESLAFLVVAGVVVVAALVVFLGKVTCPYCRWRVEKESTACPRCGRELETEFWRRPI